MRRRQPGPQTIAGTLCLRVSAPPAYNPPANRGKRINPDEGRIRVTAPDTHPAPSAGPAGEAVSAQPAKRLRSVGRAWRALRHRNYRLFFAGQGISLIGTWMQRIALSWLVYRLTGSALLLGVVGFVGQVPILALAPLAGVLADRWSLRRVLVLTQVVALVQAALLAVLTATGMITYGQLLVLAIALGVINAFDMPVRQAFVVEMVDRPEDLGNAIALNSFLVNGAQLLGPALAGVLIATVGEALCFSLNAVSYFAVIAALAAMRVSRRPSPPVGVPLFRGLAEGFSYGFGFPPIRDVLLLLALCSLMGMSYGTVMPLFAGDVLQGGPQALGFLLGATGFGAIFGAMYLASRPSVLGLGRIIATGAAMFGLGLIGVAFTRSLWTAVPFMFLAGTGMMLHIASSNTVLQTIVDDDKRGRVMSLYTMAFVGMMPFGSLLAGALAHVVGVPLTLAIGGGCCLAGGVVFAGRLRTLRPLVQPIYLRKGILLPAPIPPNPGP